MHGEIFHTTLSTNRINTVFKQTLPPQRDKSTTLKLQQKAAQTFWFSDQEHSLQALQKQSLSKYQRQFQTDLLKLQLLQLVGAYWDALLTQNATLCPHSGQLSLSAKQQQQPQNKATQGNPKAISSLLPAFLPVQGSNSEQRECEDVAKTTLLNTTF